MDLLDISLPTLEANLALDEALLLEAEAGRRGEVLRFWDWPRPGVILGAACRFDDDVIEEACQADNVPITRRASGGGTVLLDQGCLCFTLVLDYRRDPQLADIRGSYCFILGVLNRALAEFAPGLSCAGTSDLAVNGLKVSGNAQQRKRGFLLHHGTLLHDFDIGKVARYLRLPGRQPDYRQQRGHGEFLTNLAAPGEQLKQRLIDAWQAGRQITAWPQERVQQLVEEKYSRPEWRRRR